MPRSQKWPNHAEFDTLDEYLGMLILFFENLSF